MELISFMPQSSSESFRPDIEGLRGIAVLIVVAFHCGIPGFSGGFTGVDVFFVLSGYLITGLLVLEIEKTKKLSLLQFYARRIRRLLPASALTLLITTLFTLLILSPDEIVFAGRAARATALYLSNVFFGVNAADYFAANVETNPLLHTWSLAVEEQFYFFWPLLIMVVLQIFRSKRSLLSILSLLTLSSFVISVYTTRENGTFSFYQLPARAWEFGIGGVAVLLGQSKPLLKLSHFPWAPIQWAGVLAIGGGNYFIHNGSDFPGWIALIPVVGTAIALVAGTRCPGCYCCKLLGSTPLQFLGSLSYSWYLWHWPFLVFAAALKPDISFLGKMLISGLSLIFAYITHTLIENPIRFHPSLIKMPWTTISAAALITVISFGTSTAAVNLGNQMANYPDMKLIINAAKDISRIPRDKCITQGNSSDINMCTFGDSRSKTQVVLFGDSHAIQWFNPLETIAHKRGWNLTTLVKSGCPAADITFPSQNQAYRDSCTAWRSNAFRKVEEMHPSLVILSSATLQVGNNEPGNVSIDEWKQSTENTLKRLAASAGRVILIRDTPIPGFDIPSCLGRATLHSWFSRSTCEMNRDEILNNKIFEAEQSAASKLQNVRLIDMNDQICSRGMCPAISNMAIIYRDDNHLTGRFAESLWQILNLRLISALHSTPYS
jgi:peptidoglycan/LPS O-acetylase OafA/YrhL